MIRETLLHKRFDYTLALGVDLGEEVLVAELGLGHCGADLLLRSRDCISGDCSLDSSFFSSVHGDNLH